MSAWEGDVDPDSKTRSVFLESGLNTLPAYYNVDFNNIKEGEKIADGCWGPVLEGEWSGRKVAIKKFNEETSGNVMVMTREVNTMLSLQHPNILMLFGFYLILAQSDSILQCSMIMELMDCDLGKYVEERRGIQKQDGGRGLSNDEGIYIMAEIARGMNHIHKRRCSHRDLKPGNVLLKRSDISKFHVEVKIADFGTSGLMVDSNCDRNSGTTRYKAPEQFGDTKTLESDKIDVYSFGVLCSMILTGEEPYGGHLQGIELKRHIRDGGKPEIPDRGLVDDVVRVIKQCLNSKPEARPTFDEICGILDIALEKVWSTLLPLVPLASTSSHPKELTPEQEQNLGRMVDMYGLPKDYIYYVILPHDVKILRTIGSGSSGPVYEVQWAGTRHALKLFHGDSILSEYLPCSKMLPKLNHVNIVTFFGYYLPLDSFPGIMMELFKTDLQNFLNHQSLEVRNWPLLLSEEESRYIMKEIAKGMAYLHSKDILHGDLKPSNVLIRRHENDGWVVKLIDFSGGEYPESTTWYSAPEILEYISYRKKGNIVTLPNDKIVTVDGKKADVYSFAITCSDILGAQSGRGFFREFRELVIQGKFRPTLPRDISQDLKDLIARCWHQMPTHRPDFREICELLSNRPDVHQRSTGCCHVL